MNPQQLAPSLQAFMLRGLHDETKFELNYLFSNKNLLLF